MVLGPELTEALREASHDYGHLPLRAQQGEPVIRVGTVASKAATFYERIRYAVDNKEEHLLRRHAIERMLRRLIVLDYKGHRIAESLLTELIRAGYLPNDELPERLMQDIDIIIAKTFTLTDIIFTLHPEHSSSPRWKKRMLHILSGEIEEYLYPQALEGAIVRYYYRLLEGRIQLEETLDVTTHARDIQMYLLAWRSLFHAEPAALFYQLWLLYHPNWRSLHLTRADLELIAKTFAQDEAQITGHIELELGDRLLSHTRNDSIVVKALFETLKREPSAQARAKLLEDESEFRRSVEVMLAGKYREEEKKVHRGAWQAIIYIFATKTILAIGLEVPYDLFIVKKTHILPIAINVLFHPTLLFAVTAQIKLSKGENTVRILDRLIPLVQGVRQDNIHVPLPQTSLFREIAFGLYGAILITILLAIIGILISLDFNFIGISFFLLFLALVSFFAFRIRAAAKKWELNVSREGAGAFFVNVFTLPIVLMGRFLIRKFDYVNVMVFVLDFIIETPYQLALDVIDSFSSLLKEKKEQVSS